MYSDDGEKEGIVMKRIPTACCSCVIVFLTLTSLIVPSTCPAGDEKGSASKATQAEHARMAGKWLRPDGDYVLELSDVKPDGKLKAAYFNPRPINVAKAEWRSMAGRIQIFVELRDVNYPGSTYTLIYDPEKDRFNGYYFQAVQKQTFDVVFERMK
jgi:hypothetical protein